MVYTTYVLFSKNFNKIYIGYTQNIKQRLDSHNSPDNKGYTKRFQPWIIIYSEEFCSRSLAMKREKELKTAKGRKFIWNLINENFSDY